MKRFLSRGGLSAMVALAVLPAAAHAAFTPTVSVSTLTAGCGPRGLNALPSSGGGLAAGVYKYKVEATVGGTDTTPSGDLHRLQAPPTRPSWSSGRRFRARTR